MAWFIPPSGEINDPLGFSPIGHPNFGDHVQRVTNQEKQTDEMKKRVDNFQQSVQSRWDARTSTVKSPPIEQWNTSSLKNEDKDFIEGFNVLIESEDLSDSGAEVEFGPDNWSNMEVGIDLEEQGFCQGQEKSC